MTASTTEQLESSGSKVRGAITWNELFLAILELRHARASGALVISLEGASEQVLFQQGRVVGLVPAPAGGDMEAVARRLSSLMGLRKGEYGFDDTVRAPLGPGFDPAVPLLHWFRSKKAKREQDARLAPLWFAPLRAGPWLAPLRKRFVEVFGSMAVLEAAQQGLCLGRMSSAGIEHAELMRQAFAAYGMRMIELAADEAVAAAASADRWIGLTTYPGRIDEQHPESADAELQLLERLQVLVFAHGATGPEGAAAEGTAGHAGGAKPHSSIPAAPRLPPSGTFATVTAPEGPSAPSTSRPESGNAATWPPSGSFGTVDAQEGRASQASPAEAVRPPSGSHATVSVAEGPSTSPSPLPRSEAGTRPPCDSFGTVRMARPPSGIFATAGPAGGRPTPPAEDTRPPSDSFGTVRSERQPTGTFSTAGAARDRPTPPPEDTRPPSGTFSAFGAARGRPTPPPEDTRPPSGIYPAFGAAGGRPTPPPEDTRPPNSRLATPRIASRSKSEQEVDPSGNPAVSPVPPAGSPSTPVPGGTEPPASARPRRASPLPPPGQQARILGVPAREEAQRQFKDGERLLGGHHYLEAQQRFEKACQLDEGDLLFRACRTWAQYLNAKSLGPVLTALRDRLLDQLKKTLEIKDNKDRPHFYLAMILKEGGQEKEALYHFQQAVRENPYHIEAKRELRIIAAQREKKEKEEKEKKKKGGLFGLRR